MQLDRLNNHLQDACRLDGDILHIGIYRKTFFHYLLKAKKPEGKTVYGVFDMDGVGKPSKYDNPKHPANKFNVNEKLVQMSLKPYEEYDIIKSESIEFHKNIPNNKYCFVLLDCVNFYPTKIALKVLWDMITYGGTIYARGYQSDKNYSISKAVNDFIKERKDYVTFSRPMMINGVREDVLAIKCYNPKHKPKDWNINKKLTRPITVAMVYKTGGDYNVDYVNNLATAIKNNTNMQTNIVCLTDNRDGISNAVDKIVKLNHNFPKWWPKIELFQHNLFGNSQVFYFDLDTIITDNLNEFFLYDREFCALRDFYHLYKLASGLMSWHGPSSARIYEKFIQNPKQVMNKYVSEGDQGWIDQHKPICYDYFQDIFPNEIVSYKKDCINSSTKKVSVPNNAKIICFHGKPRPHEVKDAVTEYWRPKS